MCIVPLIWLVTRGPLGGHGGAQVCIVPLIWLVTRGPLGGHGGHSACTVPFLIACTNLTEESKLLTPPPLLSPPTPPSIALLKSQGFEMTRSSHFTTSSLPQDEHKMGSCTIPPGNLPLCQTTDRKAPSHSTTGNKEPAKLGPSCSKRPVLTSSRPIHLLESANFSTVSNLKSGPNSSKLNSKRTGTKPNQASRASVSRSRSSSEARSGRSSTSNADSATNPDPKCRWHAADSATKKPNKGGAEESSPCSAESATKKLGRRVERESNHYKSLRSWEGDLALGDMARHGPVLYALDKLQDKLESDCKCQVSRVTCQPSTEIHPLK